MTSPMTATEVMNAMNSNPLKDYVITPIGIMKKEDCEELLLRPIIDRALEIITERVIIPQLCSQWGRML